MPDRARPGAGRSPCRRPTMVDVAREADVSVKTVSRVVNRAPDVQPQYVARVQAAIGKLGFVRNNIARDLRSQRRTSVVGLIIGDLGNPFYSLLARSVERVARRNGSLLVIASSEEDPERERELITELCERRVDGLVVTPTYADHAFCRAEIDRGMTMVFLDRRPAGLEADVVVMDNEAGSSAGAALLYGRGHRRVGVVGQDLRIETMAARLAGVRRAARAAGVGLDQRLLRFGPRSSGQAAEAARRLLDLPDPPSAFFCCTNRLTQGVMEEVSRRGLPLDVVGFDDIDAGSIHPGPIAVVSYDLDEVGRRSAELLFRRIGGGRGAPERLVVPTRLVRPAPPGGDQPAG